MQGTGLGLAITRRLVESMGGTLNVQSVLGEGSIFRVDIPVEVIDSPLESATSNEEFEQVTNYQRLQGEGAFKILIVDDIDNNREVLHYLLEPLGFLIEEACDGEHCLKLVQTWQPDLIIMDLRMPKIDGLETTRRLRALPEFQTTPIIALSASIFVDDLHLTQEAGCNAHLGKPVRLNELLETFNELLPLSWNYNTEIKETVNHVDLLENLSEEHNAIFQELVKCGDLEGLENFSEKLRESDHYPSFVDKLSNLVRDFNLRELSQLAQHYE